MTRDSGILKQTENAKEQTEIAGEKEQIQLAYTSLLINQSYSKIESSDLSDVLNAEKIKLQSITKNKDKLTLILQNQHVYEIFNDHIEFIGTQTLYTDANPIMMSRNSTEAFWNEEVKNKITEVITKSYIIKPENIIQEWDISKNKNKSVLAWIIDNGNNGYKLTIAANQKIILTSASFLFWGFSETINMDLSAFDTSKCTDMQLMFNDCSKLETLYINNFDTSNVTNMSEMFFRCSSLSELDVSSFNTKRVTVMSRMFNLCKNIVTLDLSSFDTAKVTNMDSMFRNCDQLNTIYVDNKWNLSALTSSQCMFKDSTNLCGAVSYSVGLDDGTMANYTIGYFTYKN